MHLVTEAWIVLIAWAALVMGLVRAFTSQKRIVAAGCGLGLIIGALGGFLLNRLLAGESAVVAVKSSLAVFFLSLFATAAVAWYRKPMFSGPSLPGKRAVAGLTAFLAAAAYAVLAVGRIPAGAEQFLLLITIFVLLAGLELWIFIFRLEPLLPPAIVMTRGGLHLLAVAALVLIASLSPRLDLFAPLSMKVMKLIHDFVHQFFESMLIPDHPFFRQDVWNYIGLLFSNSVGFWGGLIIWFMPPLSMATAVFHQPIPSVAHVRQPAARRKLTAAYLRERRWRLFFPLIAALMMAGAVYNSCYPSVEYWDPKPLQVKADGSNQITIPLKDGETDLNDGKIHKYFLQQGGTKIRFFVLHRSGELTVVLDACSICQPEGYGQGEGTVICYYCKTLIPLETVGKPGGCNPIPVPFTVDSAGVRLSAVRLVSTWNEQVQSEKKLPGGRK